MSIQKLKRVLDGVGWEKKQLILFKGEQKELHRAALLNLLPPFLFTHYHSPTFFRLTVLVWVGIEREILHPPSRLQ